MTQHILTLNSYLQSPIEGVVNFFKAIYNAIVKSQTARAINIVKEVMMKRKVYRQTYKELSRLSDRELNDIGINRGDIHWLAMDAEIKAADK